MRRPERRIGENRQTSVPACSGGEQVVSVPEEFPPVGVAELDTLHEVGQRTVPWSRQYAEPRGGVAGFIGCDAPAACARQRSAGMISHVVLSPCCWV